MGKNNFYFENNNNNADLKEMLEFQIKELEEANIITRKGKNICISDIEKLKNYLNIKQIAYKEVDNYELDSTSRSA